MAEIKIKSYKVQRSGTQGLIVTLPKVWADDVNIEPGDDIDFYRNEQDDLILRAVKDAELVAAEK